jgi:hypothetical protein
MIAPRYHPAHERHPDRNARIRAMHDAGMSYEKLGVEFGLTAPRCHQICEGRRSPRTAIEKQRLRALALLEETHEI